MEYILFYKLHINISINQEKTLFIFLKLVHQRPPTSLVVKGAHVRFSNFKHTPHKKEYSEEIVFRCKSYHWRPEDSS